MTQVTNLAEAVDAWLGHYSVDLRAAHARVAELKASGIPDESVAEWLGATLALTPAEHRCAHWGDERNCVQCLSEKGNADDLEKENRRLAKTVEEQRAEIQRLQAALQ